MRQIIVLDRLNPNNGAGEPLIYKYAFWLTVPVARQPFYAGTIVSQVKGTFAPSAPEQTQLNSGQVLEIVDTINVPPGTNLAQVQTILQTKYALVQAFITSSAANSWDHYGSSWDGATWTLNIVS